MAGTTRFKTRDSEKTIDARHRDKTEEVSRKHGNTLVLHKLDQASLTRLIHDRDAGNLEAICREERLGG